MSLRPTFVDCLTSIAGIHSAAKRARQTTRTLCFCVIALMGGSSLTAQSNFGTAYGVVGPSLSGGIVPSSLGLSRVEHVNLYNGSLNVTIPLLHVGGRGSSGYDIVLPIERHWRVDYVNGLNSPGSWTDPWYSQLDDDTITPYSPGQLQIKHSSARPGNCINSGVTQDIGPYATRLVWIAPDGSETVLRDTTYDGQAQGATITTCDAVAGYTPVNRGPKFKSNDGSDLTFISDSPISDALNAFAANENNPSGTLYFPDGAVYKISNGRVGDIFDRNGNNTHLVYAQDSLGNGTITITDPAGRIINVSIGWATTTDTITYPGFDNKSRIITITHPTMDTALADGWAITNYSDLFPTLTGSLHSPFDPRVFSSIALAGSTDGTAPPAGYYNMRYNKYGELVELTLPTGAKITYTYGPGAGETGGVISISQYGGKSIYRRLVERDEKLDGTNISAKTIIGATIYSAGDPQHAGRIVTRVEVDHYDQAASLLRQEQHYIYGDPSATDSIPGPTDYPKWADGIEWREKINYGGSTPVTIDRLYQQRPCGAGDNCWYDPQADGAPAHDPQLCQVNQTIDSLTAGQAYAYDQFNNVTSKWEFDFGNTPAIGPNCNPNPTGYTRLTQNTYVAGSYTADNVHILNLLSSTTVGPTPGTTTNISYDETPLSPENGIVQIDTAARLNRGNPTTISRYSNSLNQTLSTELAYDVAGNVVSVTDPKGSATSFDYSDPNNSYAHPTKITNAVGQATEQTFDWGSGLLSSIKTPDGVTQSFEYDPIDRIRRSYYGSSTSPLDNTTYSYQGLTQQVRYESLDSSSSLHTNTYWDGLGRFSRRDTFENGSQFVEDKTTYDALGRVYTVANPFRGSSDPPSDPGVNTVYTYDGLNRIRGISYPDGSAASATYTGNQSTIVDPAGKKRMLTVDGLGRLTGVLEYADSANFSTAYAYNSLDELTNVTQSAQTRTFNFDSLGWLQSAIQPESGTVSYTYDLNGNPATKTDARGVIGTDVFDPLNRLHTVNYSDGTPTVTYTYDNNFGTGSTRGHLLSVSNTRSTQQYSAFDAMGRVAASQQITAGQVYNFSYAYNDAGSLTSETYPSGRTIYTCYDQANRPIGTSLTAGCAANNYVDTVTYAPQQEPSSYRYGNDLWRSATYNNRLQWDTVADMLSNDPSRTLLQQVLTWHAAGVADNNGTLRSATESNGNGPGTTPIQFNQTFAYDALNRINSFSDSGPVTQTYGYDNYGNKWLTAGSNNSMEPLAADWIDAATNRLSTTSGLFSYDNSGNLTLFGGVAMAYDAENRMTAESQTGFEPVLYLYDGIGQRVEKCQSNTAGVCDSAGSQTVSVYDTFGNLAAEYSNGAAVTPLCTTCYISTDQLGSTRLVTGPTGNVVSRDDFLAFGFDMGTNYGRVNTGSPNTGWGQGDGVPQAYTGQIHDDETNFDWFRTRYYTRFQGRFHSPDPFNAGVDLTNPQSWNGYAYVNNSPLSNTDPGGLQSNGGGTFYWGTQPPPANDGNSGGSPVSGFGFGWSWGGGAPRAMTVQSNQPMLESDLSRTTKQISVKNATCPAIPAHPANYPPQRLYNVGQATSPSPFMGKTMVYVALVAPDQPFDFKNQPFHGANPQYRAYGNFAFGVFGYALGFSSAYIRWGAGVASYGNMLLHLKLPPSAWGTPITGAPFGDSPIEQHEIQSGYQWAQM